MKISDILIFLLQISETASCLVGFIYFSKVKYSYWKFFPLYLAFIAISEYIGPFLPKKANELFYNDLVIPVEFLFFFWLFYKSFKKEKFKSLPVFFGGIYLLSSFVESQFYSKQQHFFSSFSYTIGNLLLLILILRFYIQLVSSDEIVFFRQNMLFWICIGLLIFFLGSFPYYGLLNQSWKTYPRIMPIYRYIVLVFNSVMYIMFAISFILGKPNKK
jgi:hypothetical protein